MSEQTPAMAFLMPEDDYLPLLGGLVDLATFARLALLPLTILPFCCLWVYFVARRIPPGGWRVLACSVVVVALLGAATFLLHPREYMFVTGVTGALSIAAFKVAAYALGRGPLTLYEDGSFMDFTGVLCLPIIPREVLRLSGGAKLQSQGQSGTAWQFLRGCCVKGNLSTLAAIAAQTPGLPVLVHHWLLGHWLSLILGMTWDFYGVIAVAVFGLDVAPSFDKPWLSTSFNDYWSRRWNLTVSYMLRVLVYEPVLQDRWLPEPDASKQQQQQPQAQLGKLAATAPAAASVTASISLGSGSRPTTRKGLTASVSQPQAAGQLASAAVSSGSSSPRHRLVRPLAPGAAAADPVSSLTPSRAKPSTLRKFLALQATFAFSGAWHALIFYNNTHAWTWHWFAFFALQAPICAAEAALARYSRASGWSLPWPVALVLTQLSLTAISHFLFLGPFTKYGLEASIMELPNLVLTFARKAALRLLCLGGIGGALAVDPLWLSY